MAASKKSAAAAAALARKPAPPTQGSAALKAANMTTGSSFNLDKALDALPDEFIQCRDFGHSWRPYSARLEQKLRCYVQSLRCARCKTIREREIGLRGELLGSHYDYPEGYTMPGCGRLMKDDRDGVRIRSIQKLVGTDTTED